MTQYKAPFVPGGQSPVRAMLGPTNTGKTHLAIERLCAHSSGAIGFPLRLLAREVYDRVCAIKGPKRVALITGEERIEPRDARWLLCTAEAMPTDRDLAFVALDEAQLAADRERGHVFTDRLLHARGREETMILGAATLEPVLRKLIPGCEVIERPRFSTLAHASPSKLSRVPPRSAIVAFSAEQVYSVAEMLRRFRGGAAVVMGALSPETRNRQVEMFQSGEVDYLVATDAIGMGLNLDISHVAFAGLSKFDGVRQRRLTAPEMAQIAGRAGRHQRDGTFSSLSGMGGGESGFTPEEIYAIEEHRFAPLSQIHWRNTALDFSNLPDLIASLELPCERGPLLAAPQATDLTVLKQLAEDPDLAGTVRTARQVERFWQVCCLPDFRQTGAHMHARFVSRLWQDLAHGSIGAAYVDKSIGDLDRSDGDIDTLQMRIAAIRSWAYIAERPDWVAKRAAVTDRARAAETRLSDALHARLTERFVSRRSSVLLRQSGGDQNLLPVTEEDGAVLVGGELIGRIAGFRFVVDPTARHADRKLLLAVAERKLPELLAVRAAELTQAIADGGALLDLAGTNILWEGTPLATLRPGRGQLQLKLELDRLLDLLKGGERAALEGALQHWLTARLAALEPLQALDRAAADAATDPRLRAILIEAIEGGGRIDRKAMKLDSLQPECRDMLRKLGFRIGAIDLYLPAMLRPGPLAAQRLLCAARGPIGPAPHPVMPPVVKLSGSAVAPPGYRRLGDQAVRIDMADKLLRQAHDARAASKQRDFVLDPAVAISTGLSAQGHERLLRLGGFHPRPHTPMAADCYGPPRPVRWRWQHAAPVQADQQSAQRRSGRPVPGNPFAALIAAEP
jgi:ATP-dependent RNA helicase SUPV3L1/SUV3